MSILIKGMEMPPNCSRCPMLEGDRMDGLCHAASRWLDDDEFWTWYVYPEGDVDDSKPCNCPLVPVPPHGRLIDADAFKKYITVSFEEVAPELEGGYKWLAERVTNDLLKDIDDAPTIIEAEEGE